MSELTLFKGGVPSFLANRELDETTKALMGNGTSGGKRISFKGNMFRMIANGEEVAVNEDRAMNIVVVKANPNLLRTYYAGQYKEGENASPDCWSSDDRKPDAKAPNKQHDTCSNCPQNIKGSGNNGESKACRYSQKLAVVLDGDMGGDVYQVSLAATSIFGKGEAGSDRLPLQAYARYLGSHNVPVTAVVTEMRFDTKSPVPKLLFKPVRGLTDSEWETCAKQADTQEALDAIKHDFVVKAKEAGSDEEFEQAKPKAKPAAKAAPAPVVEADEPVAEPVKVSKKAVAEPVADKELASIIDEWDD